MVYVINVDAPSKKNVFQQPAIAETIFYKSDSTLRYISRYLSHFVSFHSLPA